MNGTNRELVELGDVDELVRHADRLCDAGDWDGLVDLRDRSRAALERGRQLWPVASRAEYRLALDAPGPWAARVLVGGTGRFVPGPLHEVAAATHTWDDLAPHVVPGAPEGSMAAHERVVRGEDLTGDGRFDPVVLDVPLALQPWEPEYPAAEYEADGGRFPLPLLGGYGPVVETAAAPAVGDIEAVRALAELGAAWASESNGTAGAVAVNGDAAGAIGGLGRPLARLAPVSASEAMALMAWTAASGGAYGRRRGMAVGRFAAWWAASAVCGLLEDFPPEPAELGDALAELRWWAWDEGGPGAGWSCRLAVEDPAYGLAWAVSAVDSRQ